MTSMTDCEHNSSGLANLENREGTAQGHDGANNVLTVAEEQAHISVQRHDTGGVRVRVVTENAPVLHPLALDAEQVEITRHPVDREIETFPEMRDEGDVTIIPVVEERAVVVTKLFLVEEIHIRRTRTTETVEVPVTLRRQRALVEALDSQAADPTPVTG